MDYSEVEKLNSEMKKLKAINNRYSDTVSLYVAFSLSLLVAQLWCGWFTLLGFALLQMMGVSAIIIFAAEWISWRRKHFPKKSQKKQK